VILLPPFLCEPCLLKADSVRILWSPWGRANRPKDSTHTTIALSSDIHGWIELAQVRQRMASRTASGAARPRFTSLKQRLRVAGSSSGMSMRRIKSLKLARTKRQCLRPCKPMKYYSETSNRAVVMMITESIMRCLSTREVPATNVDRWRCRQAAA